MVHTEGLNIFVYHVERNFLACEIWTGRSGSPDWFLLWALFNLVSIVQMLVKNWAWCLRSDGFTLLWN